MSNLPTHPPTHPSSRTTISLATCPCCQGPLITKKLECPQCVLSLEGNFTPLPESATSSPRLPENEFAALPDEDLHFLRIFVHCEGSIREMESSLGVSYPTIKARLAKLRERLRTNPPANAKPLEPTPVSKTTFSSVELVLAALERGEITAADSVQQIKKINGGQHARRNT